MLSIILLVVLGFGQTIDRSKIDENGNYEIEYTVSETATIWTSFAADINGNGEPDETETTYSITYAAGTAGTNAQNMPQNKTDILSGTTQTISAAVPTWTGYVFTGWTLSLIHIYGYDQDAYRKLTVSSRKNDQT